MKLMLLVIASALLTGRVAAAVPAARLQGLDRLYFEHVGVPGGPVTIPTRVARFLPEAIPTNSHSNSSTLMSPETHGWIRDFPLPVKNTPRGLLVRQIVVSEETARIKELWWALYDDGNRSDVWYFRGDPTRTGNCDNPLSNARLKLLMKVKRSSKPTTTQMAISRNPEKHGCTANTQNRFQAKHPSHLGSHRGEGGPCLSNDDEQHIHREQREKPRDGYVTE